MSAFDLHYLLQLQLRRIVRQRITSRVHVFPFVQRIVNVGLIIAQAPLQHMFVLIESAFVRNIQIING